MKWRRWRDEDTGATGYQATGRYYDWTVRRVLGGYELWSANSICPPHCHGVYTQARHAKEYGRIGEERSWDLEQVTPRAAVQLELAL